MDPFIVESQVYDYLIENNWSRTVGPHCYGWLTIDEGQERVLNKMIRSKHQIFEWGRREDTMHDPVRGLLLEYIDGYTLDVAYITPPAVQILRDQLNRLHSLYIVHGNLYPRNIMVSKDGRRAYLIDFSSAKLWPPVSGWLRKKEEFLQYLKDEKQVLELFLFRLQNLKRHQGMKFSDAKSEEDAFGYLLSEGLDLYDLFVNE